MLFYFFYICIYDPHNFNNNSVILRYTLFAVALNYLTSEILAIFVGFFMYILFYFLIFIVSFFLLLFKIVFGKYETFLEFFQYLQHDSNYYNTFIKVLYRSFKMLEINLFSLRLKSNTK